MRGGEWAAMVVVVVTMMVEAAAVVAAALSSGEGCLLLLPFARRGRQNSKVYIVMEMWRGELP